MWGITSRGARLGEGRRGGGRLEVGLAHVIVRGPVEHAELHLGGEIDFSNADDVVAAVAALPHRIVTMDLAELQFADSAGARAISRMRAACERDGRAPRLVRVPASVTRVLRMVDASHDAPARTGR